MDFTTNPMFIVGISIVTAVMIAATIIKLYFWMLSKRRENEKDKPAREAYLNAFKEWQEDKDSNLFILKLNVILEREISEGLRKEFQRTYSALVKLSKIE